jgi:UPF0755 protein
VLAAAVLPVFAGTGVLLFRREVTRPAVAAGASPVTLRVPPGDTVRDVGRRLREAGLARHPAVFRLLVLWRGDAGRLRAGEYAFGPGTSLLGVLDKLSRGDVVRRTVTIPEGSILDDVARIVGEAGLPGEAFRAAAADASLVADLDPAASDLEGYLFPDTYELTAEPDAAARLPRRMVARFRDVISPELPRMAARGLSVREVVTLASLVERETGRAEERPRIAAVFLNRLERRMPLQTDPTIIYALRRAGTWDGNIRKRDLALDSPYNTYLHAGLPPGPIASPGRAALLAVLDPAPVRDLYFVSRNDGSHHFSETLAQHERAVTLFQRRRAAPPTPAAPRG